MSVKLRQKVLKDDRISLYLDFYINGKRSYEFLNLYLAKDKDANKETLRLANAIRAKRELEIVSSQHNFIPPHKKKIDFVKYFERQATSNTKKTTLNHLKNFTKSVHISTVDKKWLEAFQNYLLERVAINSTRYYMGYINRALKQAEKEGLISENPCKHIDKIKYKIEGE